MTIDTDIEVGPVLVQIGSGPSATYVQAPSVIDPKINRQVFFTFSTQYIDIHHIVPPPVNPAPVNVTIMLAKIDAICPMSKFIYEWYKTKITGAATDPVKLDANGNLILFEGIINTQDVSCQGVSYYGVNTNLRDGFGMLLPPGRYTFFLTPTAPNIAGACLMQAIDLPTIYHVGGFNAIYNTKNEITDIEDFSADAACSNGLRFFYDAAKTAPQNHVVNVRNTIPDGAQFAATAALIKTHIWTDNVKKLGPGDIPANRAAVQGAFEHGASVIISGHGCSTSIQYYVTMSSGRVMVDRLTALDLSRFNLKDNFFIFFQGCSTAKPPPPALIDTAIDTTQMRSNPGNMALGYMLDINSNCSKIFCDHLFQYFTAEFVSIHDAIVNALPDAFLGTYPTGTDILKIAFAATQEIQNPFVPVRYSLNTPRTYTQVNNTLVYKAP